MFEDIYSTSKRLLKDNTPEEILTILANGDEGIQAKDFADWLIEKAGAQEYILIYIYAANGGGRWLLADLNKNNITGRSGCLTDDKKILKNIKNINNKGYEVPALILQAKDIKRLEQKMGSLFEMEMADSDQCYIQLAKETLRLNPPKPCMKSITFFMGVQAISLGLMGYEKGPYFPTQTKVAILPGEPDLYHGGPLQPRSIDLSFDDITRIKTRHEPLTRAHEAIINGTTQSLIQRLGYDTDTLLRLLEIELENRPGPYSRDFFIEYIKSGKRIGFKIGDTLRDIDDRGYESIEINMGRVGTTYERNSSSGKVDWDLQVVSSLSLLFQRLPNYGPTEVAGDITSTENQWGTVL